MAALGSQAIADSYEQLLHVDRDGGGNTTTLVDVKDGDNGTTFALKLAQYHAEIRGTVGTGATGAGKLNLATAELTVVDNDVLGRIDFLAPLESSGTDAILAGASIWGEAEDTFAADNNSTGIVFATNTSAAAAEKMRLDSSGNLGLGTAAPAASVPIGGFFDSDGTALEIRSGATDQDAGLFLRRSDDYLGLDIYFNGDMNYHTYFDNRYELADFVFRTGTRDDSVDKEVMRIEGDNGDVTISAGDLIFGTAGKGISFAATSDAGGMTSEVLDDYEEGTWTPAYTSSSGSFATMTMEVIQATYTKIGNLVKASAYIRTDDVDVTGASGSVVIAGFPFTSNASASIASSGIGYSASFADDHPSGIWMEQNSTTANLTYRDAADGSISGLAPADLTDGTSANVNICLFTVIYNT